MFIRKITMRRLQKKKAHTFRRIKTKILKKFSLIKRVNQQPSRTLFHKFRRKKILAQKRVPVRLQIKPTCLGIVLNVKYNTKPGTYFVSIFDVNRKVLIDACTSKKVRMNQAVLLSTEGSFQSQMCNLVSSIPVLNYKQVVDLIKLKIKNVPKFDLKWHILSILTNIIDSRLLTIRIIFKKVLSILQHARDPVRVTKETLSLLGYFKTSTLIRYSIRLFEFFSGIPVLSFLEFLVGFTFPVVFTEFNISMEPESNGSRRWRHGGGTKIFEVPNKRLDWLYTDGSVVRHFLDEKRVSIRYSWGRLIEIASNGSMAAYDPDGSIRTRAAGGQEDLFRNPLYGYRNVDGFLIDKTGLPVNERDPRAVAKLLQNLEWPQAIHVLNTGTGEISLKSILNLRR